MDTVPKVKAVIVGDNRVGKSCLLSRFCSQAFSPDYLETTRTDVRDVVLAEYELVARFWDVSPRYLVQDRTRFWENAYCALIVYDITNHESFQSAVTKWYREVSEVPTIAVTMLIGCKSDLHSERAVAIKEAEAFATRQGIFFMEVSASEGTNLDLTLKIVRIRVSHALKQAQRRASSAEPSPVRVEERQPPAEPVADIAPPPSRPSVASVSTATAKRSEIFSEFLKAIPEERPSPTPAPAPAPAPVPASSSPASAAVTSVASTPAPTPVNPLASTNPHARNPLRMAGTPSNFAGAENPGVISEMQEQQPLTGTYPQPVQSAVPFSQRQMAAMHTMQTVSPVATQTPTGGVIRTAQGTYAYPGASVQQPLSAYTPSPPQRQDESMSQASYIQQQQQQQQYQQMQQEITDDFASINMSQRSEDNVQRREFTMDDLARIPDDYEPSEQRSNEEDVISDRYEELKRLFDQAGLRIGASSNEVARAFAQAHPSVGPMSRLKSFERERGGKLVPVVETAIPMRKMSTVKPKTSPSVSTAARTAARPGMKELYGRDASAEPAMFLEIKLGDGRVGQIGVREGDNAYHLAETFARAFKLERPYVKKLALLIQMQVKEYNKQHGSAAQEQKRRELRAARQREEAEMRKFLEQKPFEFATERRVDARREILFKLHIDTNGHGKMGIIAVRKGDDPFVIARNFVKTFKLRTELIDEIVQKIQEQSLVYYMNRREQGVSPTRAPDGMAVSSLRPLRDSEEMSNVAYEYDEGEDGRPPPPVDETIEHDSPPTPVIMSGRQTGAPTPPSAQTAGRVLFNLDVDIGDGRTGRIKVYEGAAPSKLAANFATTHKLGAAAVPRLQRLVEQNLQLFLQQQSEKQRLRV